MMNSRSGGDDFASSYINALVSSVENRKRQDNALMAREPLAYSAPLSFGVPEYQASPLPMQANALSFGTAKTTDAQGEAYGYLVSLGYSPHVAAGLVGNLVQESGPNLNTGSVGDNGNSFGAGQWNGPRKKQLFDFAESRGADPKSLRVQLDFLDWEMKNTERAAWGKIAASKTPEEAAVTASRAFWRPGDPWEENRTRYATSVFSRYGAG